MSRAAVLVGLAIVPLMVIAAVAEWTSRVHAGMASLRRSSTLRTLGTDEHRALAPLRALAGCDHDDQIKRLRGAFTGGACRNSFPVGDGLLGGVPALVPKQAWPYLAEDNEAEVVLGKRAAVVVCLNGFTIAAARPDAATSRVCGERLETPEEVSMRRGPGLRPSPLVIAALASWAAAGAQGCWPCRCSPSPGWRPGWHSLAAKAPRRLSAYCRFADACALTSALPRLRGCGCSAMTAVCSFQRNGSTLRHSPADARWCWKCAPVMDGCWAQGRHGAWPATDGAIRPQEGRGIWHGWACSCACSCSALAECRRPVRILHGRLPMAGGARSAGIGLARGAGRGLHRAVPAPPPRV